MSGFVVHQRNRNVVCRRKRDKGEYSMERGRGDEERESEGSREGQKERAGTLVEDREREGKRGKREREGKGRRKERERE